MTNELQPGENHPAAHQAFTYIKQRLVAGNPIMLLESFSSCAIEGNRLAELCGETLKRIIEGKPVGERYVMGLAWTLRNMADDNDQP